MTDYLTPRICDDCGYIKHCMKFLNGWYCGGCAINNLGYQEGKDIIAEYEKKMEAKDQKWFNKKITEQEKANEEAVKKLCDELVKRVGRRQHN